MVAIFLYLAGVNHNAPFVAHHAYNTDLCYMYKSFFHCWAQSTSIWGCYFVCDKLSLEVHFTYTLERFFILNRPLLFEIFMYCMYIEYGRCITGSMDEIVYNSN